MQGNFDKISLISIGIRTKSIRMSVLFRLQSFYGGIDREVKSVGGSTNEEKDTDDDDDDDDVDDVDDDNDGNNDLKAVMSVSNILSL